MEKYEQLQEILANGLADVEKSAGGNKAAGVRVRKMLQEVISVSKEYRKEISAKNRPAEK